ncbi:MAG TPA: c-type cytochrome [Solirubrobacterales bacterium]|nr:c-type cytochrome [Solirubrobacterales bacterium]
MRRTLSLAPVPAASPLLWFAVLGAPAAWVVQLFLGYWLSEAQCSPTGGEWGISLDAWGIAAAAVCEAVAVASVLTALALFRRTRDAEDEGPPPGGRTHFLSVVGLTVAPLFVVLIAMTAVGTVALSCSQALPPAGIVNAPGGREQTQRQLGAGLYAANCASCHGFDGQGVPEPSGGGVGNITGQGPPLQGVGAIAPDFYLRTGRMPIGHAGEEPERQRPLFNDRQIRALVSYVASFGGGPAIPRPRPRGASLSEGLRLFTDHCAGCHQVVGEGGYVTGARVPVLSHATARQIAEAVRIGPFLMPRFSPKALDDRELNAIVAYVLASRDPVDEGGFGLGHVGPVPEGMVAWFVAAVVLVGVCMLLGRRLKA